MNFINLTPHTINIIGDDGKIIRSFEPSGFIAQREIESIKLGEIDGITLGSTSVKLTEGIPEPAPDTEYLVSPTAAQGSTRTDLLVPFDEVRDKSGSIIGYKFLSRIEFIHGDEEWLYDSEDEYYYPEEDE